MELNKVRYIVILFLLWGCKTKDYFVISDAGMTFKNEFCNHQDQLQAKTLKKLLKNRIIGSLKDPVHIQILFKGNNEELIVLINCNSGFQNPRYLGFYSNNKLKIISNSLNIELIYQEYLSFCKTNDVGPEESKKIWSFIDSFIQKELLNKYHKVNW